MKDKVIINLATGNYIVGQDRLRSTLSGFYDGDILFFTDESQFSSPTHKENPYAFKTYAFQHALNLGYKKILWLDASIYAIKDITSVWDIIEKNGYIMQEAGWNCGQWSNDKSLEYFGLTRDEAMLMPMYGNAGLLGLDLDKELPKIFKDQIRDYQLIITGGVRHDGTPIFARDDENRSEKFNHPLVYKSPLTGVEGLYFPYLQVRGFVDVPQAEATELIKWLGEYTIQEKYVYHHHWQDGDIVLGDQWHGIHKRWKFVNLETRVLHRAALYYPEQDYSV